jgi:hypothetical protein
MYFLSFLCTLGSRRSNREDRWGKKEGQKKVRRRGAGYLESLRLEGRPSATAGRQSLPAVSCGRPFSLSPVRPPSASPQRLSSHEARPRSTRGAGKRELKTRRRKGADQRAPLYLLLSSSSSSLLLLVVVVFDGPRIPVPGLRAGRGGNGRRRVKVQKALYTSRRGEGGR